MNIIKVKEVDLHVVRKCNNRCEYCYVSPNDPKVKSAIKSNAPIYGDTDTLRQVISKIHSVAGAEDLVFVGGDPCQHPDLVDLIKHAKIEGLNTVVLSNTHSYRDNGATYDIAGLTEWVDELNFTLHGATPEIHNAFTKCPGSYELATTNLKRFAMARRDGQAIGIILNMVPEIIHDLPRIMRSIVSRLDLQPGLDFFTIQRIAPSGGALKNFEKWKLTKPLIEKAFHDFEEIESQLGFEVRCCIDAFPWCAVPERYWSRLEPLRGGCNWGKPDGVLSALMTGELQRCALCQSTLKVNILDMETPEEFANFMLNHPVLKAVAERKHLDDKCLNCKLLDKCGGGCIVSSGGSSGDPYYYSVGLMSYRKGHDYIAD